MQESNPRLMMGLGVFALGVSMAFVSTVTPANAATPGYQPQGQSSSHSMQHGAPPSAQPYRGQSSASAATPAYHSPGHSHSYSMQHGGSASAQSPRGQPATQSNPNQPPAKTS
jgi:hypothetical protein